MQATQKDPHLTLERQRRIRRMRRQNPARVLLDRAHDERRSALRIQTLPQCGHRFRAGEAHVAVQGRAAGLQANQRIDAHAIEQRDLLRTEVDERHELAFQAGIGQRQSVPDAVLVGGGQYARDDAARRHPARVARTFRFGAHPRKVRDGVLARLLGASHPQDRGIRGIARPRRIPNQQGAAPLAVARGCDERRAAEIARGRRRNAQQIDARTAVEREQTGAFVVRADDVVVAELLAVGAAEARLEIRNRIAGTPSPRRIRAARRQRARGPNELRCLQRVGNVVAVRRIERQSGIKLLIVDELRAEPAQTLHDEVEALEVALDAIVVDGYSKELAAARLLGLQTPALPPARDLEQRARRTIRDPNDDGFRAAVQEVMLHGLRHEAERAKAAEHSTKLVEARDRDRLVQRSPLRPADERRDGRSGDRNGFGAVERASFSVGRQVDGFRRHAARGRGKTYDSSRAIALQLPFVGRGPPCGGASRALSTHTTRFSRPQSRALGRFGPLSLRALDSR